MRALPDSQPGLWNSTPGSPNEQDRRTFSWENCVPVDQEPETCSGNEIISLEAKVSVIAQVS